MPTLTLMFRCYALDCYDVTRCCRQQSRHIIMPPAAAVKMRGVDEPLRCAMLLRDAAYN